MVIFLEFLNFVIRVFFVIYLIVVLSTCFILSKKQTESLAPVHLIEDWQINRSSLRRFALGLCKEFAVTLTLTSISLSVRFLRLPKVWAQTMTLLWTDVSSGCWRERDEVKTRHWPNSALSDFLLGYWFPGLARSLYLPLSLLLAARSFLDSQSGSDESCPSRASYFPPSSPHSSAMLCIQNAEMSPGGFEQGRYCYRRGEGRKRASRCY